MSIDEPSYCLWVRELGDGYAFDTETERDAWADMLRSLGFTIDKAAHNTHCQRQPR